MTQINRSSGAAAETGDTDPNTVDPTSDEATDAMALDDTVDAAAVAAAEHAEPLAARAEVAPTSPAFSDFDIKPEIITALTAVGITHTFAIQELTLPIALAGADLIGQARTGTGKTLGFGVPLLNRLESTGVPGAAPQALVIAPTRELAVQVAGDLAAAGKDLGARVITIYGGRAYEPQIDALKKGVDVAVGTPGRLLDLAQQGHLVLGNVRCLVLDEADEMLDLGFLPDIEKFLKLVPAARQTMLFSATMPGPIVALARTFLDQPIQIRAEHGAEAPRTDHVDQFVYRAHAMDKIEMLARVLQARGRGLTLIFTRTKRTAAKVADELEQRGFAAAAVHGDLGQGAREQALRAFRSGKVDVLVATDVAARGLDVDGITHVVNYQTPEDAMTYVHRIGRTARAGASGTAITLVDWDDLPRWKLICDALNLPMHEPAETYSTSEHLYIELDIPRETGATLPRSSRTRAGLDAEQLEDLGGPDSRSRGGRTGGPARSGRSDSGRSGSGRSGSGRSDSGSSGGRGGAGSHAAPSEQGERTERADGAQREGGNRNRSRQRTRGGRAVTGDEGAAATSSASGPSANGCVGQRFVGVRPVRRGQPAPSSSASSGRHRWRRHLGLRPVQPMPGPMGEDGRVTDDDPTPVPPPSHTAAPGPEDGPVEPVASDVIRRTPPGDPTPRYPQPPARPGRRSAADPVLAAYHRRMTAARNRYLAVIGVVVVAIVAMVAVAWSRSEIHHVHTRVAAHPPSTLSAARFATTPHQQWHSSDTAALGYPLVGGTVVTHDEHTVRGRDARTGKPTWYYTRTDRTVCAAVQQGGIAIAVYRLKGACNELTGLDAQTGRRVWTRTVDMDGYPLLGTPQIQVTTYTVVFVTPTVLYAIDPVGGGTRYYYAPTRCTINRAVLGSGGLLISQTCHKPDCSNQKFCADGVQLVLRSATLSRSDDYGSDNKDQIQWLLRGVSDLPVAADGQVLGINPSSRQVFAYSAAKGVRTPVTLSPQPTSTDAGPAISIQNGELIRLGTTNYVLPDLPGGTAWSTRTPYPLSVTPTRSSFIPDLATSLVLATGPDGIDQLDPATGKASGRFAVGASTGIAYPAGSGFIVAGTDGTTVYQ